MLYIWLKSGIGDAKLQELEEKGLLKKSWVKKDSSSGRDFISFSTDPLCPANKIPRLPAAVVSKVTFMEEIHDNFRPEGVYRVKKTTFLIKTCANTSYKGMRYAYRVVYYQKISASAQTLNQLKKIYSLIRTGVLSPEANWESSYVPSAEAE